MSEKSKEGQDKSNPKKVDQAKVNPYDNRFNWSEGTQEFLNMVEQEYVPLPSGPKDTENHPINQGYYWYMPCKENSEAPIMVTMIGGPGMCCMSKALGRHNPYKVNREKQSLEKNENDITDRYHLLYIESPVGSGFSYCNEKTKVKTFKEIGENAVDIFTHLIKKHPNLKNCPWWFNGESFCGLQLPVVACAAANDLKLKVQGVILECCVIDNVQIKSYNFQCEA